VRVSLPISFLVHAAILLAGVIVLPSPDSYKVADQESIPVDIIDISEISKRVATQKDAAEKKPEDEPAPPKVEQVEKPKPAPEPAKEIKEAAKEPAPTPKVEEKPVQEAEKQPDPAPLEELIRRTEEAVLEPKPELQPENKAETKPVPLPRQKPKPPQNVASKEKKKPEFNPDDIAALLNKVDDKKKSPVKASDRPGSPRKATFTSLSGSDDQLSADMIDWLRQQVETCWSPPTGVREAQNLVVRVRFSLGQDGSVLSGPDVLNSSIDALFQAAAASAVRAVLMCAPYRGLPLDKYDAWREVILNFDPSRMLATN
jgi:outer membrane biosynthesis protein TonB